MSVEEKLIAIQQELRSTNTKLDNLTSLLTALLVSGRSLDNLDDGRLIERVVDLEKLKHWIEEHQTFPRLIINKEKAQMENIGYEGFALAFFLSRSSEGFKRFQRDEMTFADLRDTIAMHRKVKNKARAFEIYFEQPLSKAIRAGDLAVKDLDEESRNALKSFQIKRKGARLHKFKLPRRLFIWLWILLRDASPFDIENDPLGDV